MKRTNNLPLLGTALVALLGLALLVAAALSVRDAAVPAPATNPDSAAVVTVDDTDVTPVAKRTCPDGWCSNITHNYPDDGFDDAFGIKCAKYRSDGSTYNTTEYIPEGSGGYAQGCSDVHEIYVKSGTQIKCWQGSIWTGSWQIQWDSTGWHDTDPYPFSGQDHGPCVYQLD